ncbi:MAG: glycosyltransferase family 4 protein [Victivallales bacterium]|nr:glycosyltransferase family 4 protein [Victivallales bacterium]
MSRNLNICHVITRMIVGGAQENTLFTCQGLLEHGHRVTLVTGPSPGPEGELLKQGCPAGLTILEVPTLCRELNPWKDWQAYRALRRIFRENRYDVVHTHASKAGIVGRLAARKEGVPLVVHTVHGNPFFQYQNALVNRFYIWAESVAARKCDRIYAVAQAMIDQCVEAGIAPREKYQVVYSGMDLESFLNARPEPELRATLGIPDDSPVIGVIARLFPFKGHDVLIEAAPEIARACPNVRFLLVGDGILRDELEARARALGVERNFVFAGLIPPNQVCRYTALMDILAHLSLREGLPRACVQALACGVPVVAYPLDGTPEVVLDGQTGLLAPPKDTATVAHHLITLLQDSDLRHRLGEAGRTLVKTRFAWRHMADTLEQDYLSRL